MADVVIGILGLAVAVATMVGTFIGQRRSNPKRTGERISITVNNITVNFGPPEGGPNHKVED